MRVVQLIDGATFLGDQHRELFVQDCVCCVLVSKWSSYRWSHLTRLLTDLLVTVSDTISAQTVAPSPGTLYARAF